MAGVSNTLEFKLQTIAGSRIPATVIIVLCALGVAACAASRQARNAEFSGFLADYSTLMPGMTGEANHVYRSTVAKDKAAFGKFTNILIDPVTIYRDPKKKEGDKDEDKMARKDLNSVANNFYMMLEKSLRDDYVVVREAGPDTLRLTVVITNAKKDVAVLDAVSTVWPAALVTSSLFSYAADHPGFSGDITMEARVADAATGEILIASVDRRLGAKNLSADLFNDWQTVNDAIEFWSKRQQFEFCKLRGAADCLSPDS